MHRIFATPVASVYPLYIKKLERKGRTQAELDVIIEWLTGFDQVALNNHLAKGTSFSDFFAQAKLNPAAAKISGTICGVKIQEIRSSLMKQIRYLDKLVDELFQGRPMAKVLRL